MLYSFLNVDAQPNFQITFNAGTSALAGTSPIYMYAGAGVDQPGNFWQYNVGNITNPGTGLMTSLGQNIWSICIEPYSYFSQGPGGAIPNGSTIYNISIIFHNADFSIQVDKDPNNAPINLVMTNNPPTSSWNMVTGVYQNCTLNINDFQVTEGILSNYPNPARTNTVFIYTSKAKGKAKINVFNTLGKKVFELNSELKNPGTHSNEWDLKSSSGNLIPAGVYFYNLEINGQVLQTNQLIVTGN